MRAVFICVSSPFTPSMLYTENYLIRAAVESGYEVLVIASDQVYESGELRHTGEVLAVHEMGYELVRYPYRRMFGRFVDGKVRHVPALRQKVTDFRPDLVFFNGPQTRGIRCARAFKALESAPRVVCQDTATYDNSATNWLSRTVLHGLIYRRWIRTALPHLDAIYYAAPECRRFLTEVYGLPSSSLEPLSLPGEVINSPDRARISQEFRQFHEIPEASIVFLHAGKMNSDKQTIPLLKSFLGKRDDRFRLLLAGSFAADIESEARRLIARDPRIQYLGFLEGRDLVSALCATDMYLQPGSVSQSAQTAIGCGTPVTLRNDPIYQDLCDGNGFLIDSIDELACVFDAISARPHQLAEMSRLSHEVARTRLDYLALFRVVIAAETN